VNVLGVGEGGQENDYEHQAGEHKS
jgi:hypothetical protein